METFSPLLAIPAGNSPVPNEFPAKRPVTQSFNVFFDLHPNKRLSKQWWGWWFETQSCPLWRQCNAAKKTQENALENVMCKNGVHFVSALMSQPTTSCWVMGVGLQSDMWLIHGCHLACHQSSTWRSPEADSMHYVTLGRTVLLRPPGSTFNHLYNILFFSQKYTKNTLHSSSVRMRYEVLFVSPQFDL